MRRLVSLVLTGMFLLFLLAGCGSDTDAQQQEAEASVEAVILEEETADQGITLTLFCQADDLSKPYLQKMISLYEETTGNTINQQGLEVMNAEAIALDKFASGDVPDIYIDFGNTSLEKFEPEKNFVDWSDAPWVSDIEEAILPQATYQDWIVGLPFWESSHSGCFYNKKIFEQLDLQVPKTQAEFDAVCDTLVENGIQPIYLAAANSWPIFYQFALDPVLEEHPEYIDRLNAGEMTYADIPEFWDMCEWFRTAAEKGYFGDIFSTDTWDYSSEVLGTGEAAMMFVWDTWFSTDYADRPSYYSAADFGIMPVFMGTCDEGTYEGGNVNLIMANKNSEHVETAMEFINFVADPDNYNQAFSGISTGSVFKGQTTNVLSSQYQENQESVDSLIRASHAQTGIVGFDQVAGGEALTRLMLGEITVEECIAIMDQNRIATLETLD
ncbi:MAG: carbohydrate ABC transporter substrate-binding protein [Lachnospiraceae bacterium]|nr:carbohydrate ABC transporter substrate-binding protein [Lachnospiraceae bacterium]